MSTRSEPVSRKIDNLREALRSRFSLKDDRANDAEIDADLRSGISMRGTNLWVLMFAILIASIGLNVNSTAVIIGAMLISPLMGPIMGVGYGAGIYDFQLIRQSLKNLGIAASLSLLTSTIYFAISPLTTAQSELLARTNPTIWDVMVAFFGGLSGIVAATRKQKTNVIPGVAIATALMPPLCTAGYGLATRSWGYFLGAFYLFTINCVFIAAASAFVTRAFHLQRKKFVDTPTEKRMAFYMWLAMIVTILPSLYLAYRLVGEEVFKTRAEQFVHEQLEFRKTHVSGVAIDSKKKQIEVTLIGDVLPESALADISTRLARNGLSGARLDVYQADDNRVDVASLKTSLLGDLYKESQVLLAEKDRELQALRVQLDGMNADRKRLEPIPAELHALFPQVVSIHLAEGSAWYADQPVNLVALGTSVPDIVVVLGVSSALSKTDQDRIDRWLKARVQNARLRLVIERHKPQQLASNVSQGGQRSP
ncbi:MAG: DUF389 domain-containing protein [Steroidobacteraceae bacterium]